MDHIKIVHIRKLGQKIGFHFGMNLYKRPVIGDLRTDYGELIIDGPAHRFLNHG